MSRLQQFLALLLLAVSTSAWMPSPSTRSGSSSSALYMADIQKGTVKWFDSTKGFGFVVPTDGSPDVFVHQTSIQAEGFRSLAEGEEVEYQLEIDAKSGKSKAVQVTGPGGVDVKGAPFQPKQDYDNYY
jgi:cold shock CspA family protein